MLKLNVKFEKEWKKQITKVTKISGWYFGMV